MESREKQIEEMFNDIVEIADRPYYYDNKGHAHIDFVDLDKLAEKLSEKYQPKIPESSVVLSEEEFDKDYVTKQDRDYWKNRTEILGNKLKQVRKETAEKCFKEFKEICDLFFNRKIDCCEFMARYHNLAKQFNVEIKDNII